MKRDKDFEITYQLLDASNLQFTVLSLNQGFTKGQILKVNSIGKEADGALIVAKEKGVLEYLGQNSYEVKLEAGLMKCIQNTKYDLSTKVALGEISTIALPQFRSIVETSCSSYYSIVLELKDGSGLYDFISYEQPGGKGAEFGSITFSP